MIVSIVISYCKITCHFLKIKVLYFYELLPLSLQIPVWLYFFITPRIMTDLLFLVISEISIHLYFIPHLLFFSLLSRFR